MISTLNTDNMSYPDDEILSLSAALFDHTLSEDDKMQVLSKLAHRGDRAAYEVLKAYVSSPDPGLEAIAEIALGECELFLHTSICGDDDIVFTGIGPEKNMLRYFYMLLPLKDAFTDLDKSVIETLLHERAEELQCIIEEIAHKENFSSCTLLMPVSVSVSELIEPVIARCHDQEVYVNPDYYCGGWIPDATEIKDILAVLRGEKNPDEPHTACFEEEPF